MTCSRMVAVYSDGRATRRRDHRARGHDGDRCASLDDLAEQAAPKPCDASEASFASSYGSLRAGPGQLQNELSHGNGRSLKTRLGRHLPSRSVQHIWFSTGIFWSTMNSRLAPMFLRSSAISFLPVVGLAVIWSERPKHGPGR